MTNKRLKIIFSLLITILFLTLGISSSAAQSNGNIRNISVSGITVTVGTKTVGEFYSDPADYSETLNGSAFADIRVNYHDIGTNDLVVYTPLYPDTTTGRVGNYTEYVCEKQNGKFVVTKINSSGDGSTYIPIGGFVLSLNSTSYPNFAKIGDQVKLGGSSVTIPTKAVESSKGKRVVIDAMNVKRSTTMVVYYDHEYGQKTGTNIYGTEVICQYDFDKNAFVVTDFREFYTGDDSGSEIPDNGFVLSAYGSGYRQLLAQGHHFDIGDEIKTVGFSFVSMTDSVMNNTYNTLASRVNTVISSAETRLAQLYDLDRGLLAGYISEARAKLAEMKQIKDSFQSGTLTDDERATQAINFTSAEIAVEQLCDRIVTASAESKVVSARSTWHRPCEKNYAEIKANVEMFKEIGVNLIFVETFYHGSSAFKSDLSDIPYHSSLSDQYTDTEKNIVYKDYLSAFVACCDEYGIEVHAWVENFYVGISGSARILQNHPDWIMYNDDGSYLQRNEGGLYIFIDPANKEVQDLLIDFYNEIFEKHPGIKGLNLDYIRYPVSNRSQDTGYTMAAMKGFYESLGKSFTADQLADRTKMANKFKQLFNGGYLIGGQTEANSNYNLWVQYRTDIITDYVLRIKNEVKEPNGIILSTAVFASISESISSKKADWQIWYKNGWIDIATPMAYYTSAGTVKTRVEEMINMGGNNCLYYTGIASSYSGLPAYQNKEFIEASYNAGASGYVIFSSAQIVGHGDVQLALSSGVNRKWAVLPHADVYDILAASFADILDKSDRIYISAGSMTVSGREGLADMFSDILNGSGNSASAINKAYKSVSALAKDAKNYASGYALQRIVEQLNELASILDARISMKLIADGLWNPGVDSVRPEVKDEVVDPPVVPDDGGETPDDGGETPDDGGETPDDGGETPDDGGETPDEDGEKPTVDNGEPEPDHNNNNKEEANNEQEEEKMGFFRRIFRAIVRFFVRLFKGDLDKYK